MNAAERKTEAGRLRRIGPYRAGRRDERARCLTIIDRLMDESGGDSPGKFWLNKARIEIAEAETPELAFCAAALKARSKP